MATPEVMVIHDARFYVAIQVLHGKIFGVMPDEASDDPIALPVTGELDLHTFRPAEITRLLDDYFAECLKRGIRRVRVIHGKGIGTLRTTVHAHLRQSPYVSDFSQGDETSGGWGATWVTLHDRLSN